MGAGHQLRGAILGPERIEEGKRGNLVGELDVGSVSMQFLRAATHTRLTPLDLGQEEWLLQDMMHGGQHDRQAADLLHCRIEVDERMTPIGATRTRPHVRRQHPSLESVAKRPDPGLGNRTAQQEVALLVETPCVIGGETTDLVRVRNSVMATNCRSSSRYLAIPCEPPCANGHRRPIAVAATHDRPAVARFRARRFERRKSI
jgi:hypothetical protein